MNLVFLLSLYMVVLESDLAKLAAEVSLSSAMEIVHTEWEIHLLAEVLKQSESLSIKWKKIAYKHEELFV